MDLISTVEAARDDSHVYITHEKTIGQGAPARLAPIVDVQTCDEGRAVEGAMAWPTSKETFFGFNAWYQKHLLGLVRLNTHDRRYRIELSGLVSHTHNKSDGYDFVVYAATTPRMNTPIGFAGTVDTNPNRSFIGNFFYWLTRKKPTESLTKMKR